MALYANTNMPDYYFVCVLNSSIVGKYIKSYINTTCHFQINDARQLPIVIPSIEQLKIFEVLFDRAIEIKKAQFSNQISDDEAESKLHEIQKKLDEITDELYNVI
jgi:hypothetical protein